MPPRAGTMLGSFRLTWPESRKRLYEFLIIEEAENGEVVMNFRHFGPRMELWKNEVEAPLSFVLVEAGPGRAVFEAPDRAQKPARFIFESDETGRSLTIVVESLDAGGETEDSFTGRIHAAEGALTAGAPPDPAFPTPVVGGTASDVPPATARASAGRFRRNQRAKRVSRFPPRC
jgi:hypothetical protein